MPYFPPMYAHRSQCYGVVGWKSPDESRKTGPFGGGEIGVRQGAVACLGGLREEAGDAGSQAGGQHDGAAQQVHLAQDLVQLVHSLTQHEHQVMRRAACGYLQPSDAQ